MTTQNHHISWLISIHKVFTVTATKQTIKLSEMKRLKNTEIGELNQTYVMNVMKSYCLNWRKTVNYKQIYKRLKKIP